MGNPIVQSDIIAKSIDEIKKLRIAGRPSIEAYLNIGEYLHYLEKRVPSPKLRNPKMLEEYPDTCFLDAALRSNAKRLWEALNGLRDTDILEVLGVTDIRQYDTSNPTVIIRRYTKKKKALVISNR